MNNPETITVDDLTFVPFITEEQIQERIKALAQEIEEKFRDKDPIFIGVLNGSVFFITDLLKNYVSPCEIDFLKLSSYHGTGSTGMVKLHKDINAKVNDRHVIVVEDIVDTGLSLQFLKDLILRQNPASLSIATLLYKPDNDKYKLPIDYIGFTIPPAFVIGYGLDLNQRFRNLRSIYVLKEGGN